MGRFNKEPSLLTLLFCIKGLNKNRMEGGQYCVEPLWIAQVRTDKERGQHNKQAILLVTLPATTILVTHKSGKKMEEWEGLNAIYHFQSRKNTKWNLLLN